MIEAEFTLDEAYAIIWWLTHLLGGAVTIPESDKFWDDNLPDEFRVGLEHDAQGNAVLVAARKGWVVDSRD